MEVWLHRCIVQSLDVWSTCWFSSWSIQRRTCQYCCTDRSWGQLLWWPGLSTFDHDTSTPGGQKDGGKIQVRCVNLSSLKLIFLDSSLNITVFLAGWYILLLAQNNETSCCMFKNVQPGTIWMRIHISSVPKITFHHFWTQVGQKCLFWEEFSATSLYCNVHRLQGHNCYREIRMTRIGQDWHVLQNT